MACKGGAGWENLVSKGDMIFTPKIPMGRAPCERGERVATYEALRTMLS